MYPKLQHDPSISLSIENCSVLDAGPWSVELNYPEKKQKWSLRSVDGRVIDKWKKYMKELKLKAKKNQKFKIKRAKNEFIFDCKICKKVLRLDRMFLRDKDDPSDPHCLQFLKDVATAMVEAGDIDSLNAEFSLQDLRDILTSGQFDKYLSDSLTGLIKSNAMISRCVKCKAPFELVPHSCVSKNPYKLANIQGLDNRPLSDEAEMHFLKNRIRCQERKCDAEFCRECKMTRITWASIARNTCCTRIHPIADSARLR